MPQIENEGSEFLALDLDGDGKITRADVLWSDLRVWQDYNRNGLTDSGELKSLDELGITILDLATRALDIRTPQGARLTETANVTAQRRAVRWPLGHKACRRASLGIMTGKPEFALLSRR